MPPFRRRHYHRPAELVADVRAVLAHRKALKAMGGGRRLSSAFRERLMLAVTAVNGCRYCSYFHARVALREGLTPAEIRALGEGAFHDCPDEELPALLYAQHWASADARPDPVARERLAAIYGPAAVEAIELALCSIRIGNLLGNTADYGLYRLSLGRMGGVRSSYETHTERA